MTPEQSRIIHGKLPNGWLRQVQARLAAKGIHRDFSTISRVKKAYIQDLDVEEAIVAVAEAETKRRAALDKMITRLGETCQMPETTTP